MGKFTGIKATHHVETFFEQDLQLIFHSAQALQFTQNISSGLFQIEDIWCKYAGFFTLRAHCVRADSCI